MENVKKNICHSLTIEFFCCNINFLPGTRIRNHKKYNFAFEVNRDLKIFRLDSDNSCCSRTFHFYFFLFKLINMEAGAVRADAANTQRLHFSILSRRLRFCLVSEHENMF